MKKIILLVVVVAFAKANAQTYVADTLKNALAYENTYIPIPVYGKTRSGHIYTCGLNNSYGPKGEHLPMQLVKIDMTAKTVSYKTLVGTLSSSSVLWGYAFDNAGNLYIGFNSYNRKIYKFNFKDSISYENLGNGFKDGGTLAYSMALGTDGHMYFGGSSGDPYVSEYNPKNGKLIKYPSMDSANDYVLTIAGDSDYIYAQTGQRNSIQLWAMKKADSTKKLLFRITNLTRMGLGVKTNGVFVSFHSDTLSGYWKLEHGKAIKFTGKTGDDITYSDFGKTAQPKIQGHFDDIESTYSYSINGSAYENVHLATNDTKNTIRAIFGFKNDPDNIYYVGDYYGNYYRYNITTNKSELLGKTVKNIYSTLQASDSTIYFGNYPSAALLYWNKEKPWTLNRFINGGTVEVSKTSNPRLVGYFKSQTPAGFHHLEGLVRDYKGNIVGAGDVIRIGNTCSIAVYNPSKDSLYGYDFNRIKGLSFSGLAVWKNTVVLSTNNYFKGTPKLYYYNSILNKMDDSLILGFSDYGKVYVEGNILTGIANDRIYKIDLASKKLITNVAYKTKSITNSYMLSDGTILISTPNDLPASFGKFIKVPFICAYQLNKDAYISNGANLIRLKNAVK